MAELLTTKDETERAILVAADTGAYDLALSLAELEELASTADVEVVGQMSQKRSQPDRASYLGPGKLEELKEMAENMEVDLLIFDNELTATQIRNIETITDIRTIDRTMLILDIFSQRATSSEGRLQVELARQRYLLPRLMGMGKTLSRLGGGGGGGAGARRGAGETKLETDRRHIRRRVTALEEELAEMEKRRVESRVRRKKNGAQTVSIVGYTNVGKSTLINALTDADVMAEDMLFATLDPTARQLLLPDGRNVIIVDTVGLIRRLPHHLVRAFHSTLEEAKESDLILNVCDISSDEADEQIEVTRQLLEELGADDIPVITVYNKCDRWAGPLPLGDNVACISAAQKTGLDELLTKIAAQIPTDSARMTLLIPYAQGEMLGKIRLEGKVFSEEYQEDGILVDILVDGPKIKQASVFQI